MVYSATTDKQNKGPTVAAALSFHKPLENKVYKFLFMDEYTTLGLK